MAYVGGLKRRGRGRRDLPTEPGGAGLVAGGRIALPRMFQNFFVLRLRTVQYCIEINAKAGERY
jgi:hypothetical protein